jgi:hypothetical protein
MKRRLPIALLAAACLVALFAVVQSGSAKAPPRAPKGFFGIAPQSILTDADLNYMKAGGIEVIRWPLFWSGVQPTPKRDYQWSGFDVIVEIAARHGIQVLPFALGTPDWIGKDTKLPVDSARARSAWAAFLKAAVERYGPGGDFWAEHSPRAVKPSPSPYQPEVSVISRPLPIRTWQIWNEANFFYFTYPVSPARYARLVQISGPAIKGVDPGAQVVLTGLFGKPTARGPRGMPAAKFLDAMYRSPGIEKRFDGIALHPYAEDARTLEELVEEFHQVTIDNHDRPALYITEMGWGSQNDPNVVSFERGVKGQVKELRSAYGYLLRNHRRLNLKQVHWYSWKDISGGCNFCDSVGLFHEGAGFHPKPAWQAFVSITRGRARP